MSGTLDCLSDAGKQIRKHRLREAINQDRARKWIALALEEGYSHPDIRGALGFTVAEYNQLRGTA